ncbi:Hormone receptor domain [Popillia japonica]|uniref:Hormone receptor domain n=1 Tax=Popillia japonica TaxID=7064 RepID=A0AAW1N340_POPJA
MSYTSVENDLLIMTESFLLQGKKIKEQEDKCLGEYGKAAFSNSTQPILNETTGQKFCPAFFDGFYCWPPTPADTLAVEPCPVYVAGFLEEQIYNYDKVFSQVKN